MSPEPNLDKTPVFALFPEEARLAARALWRQRRFRRGTPIFWAGDNGDSVVILAAGQIRIWLESAGGEEAVIATLGPSSIIGEMSVLDGGTRSANATAVTDCEVFVIARDDFLGILRNHPEASIRLSQLLARRLRDQDKLYEDAIFLDVPGRIAKRLIEVAASQDSPEVRIKIKDLAAMVGSSREHVSRALSVMERGGVVAREHSVIRIRDIPALASRAGLQ
ncbi:MAG: cyclic nucleotide-binding domain-containing protein [Dehalococcoidia bacterium]|nr:cyclic nucleotide-binding domain-containing protein [Dehalococcoidia bacterium]